MKTSFIRSGLLTLTLCSAGPALAEATSAQRAACTPDVWRLCASEIPDVSRITACLRREKPKLNPTCRQVMNEADREPAPRSVASNQRRS